MGFRIAAHPLELLMASQRAMQRCLEDLRADRQAPTDLASFAELQAAVGFPEYYALEAQYAEPEKKP